ncbi:MAG: efflux RND transporter periplasmic adaptor subunit [Burkholderiaceae bacterium]|jgi:membrane fusion protein (multidrug efflux system)|nr:efflux RND transporter periplasmic adaptor subunit [Burkholderiaceae bacterium]
MLHSVNSPLFLRAGGAALAAALAATLLSACGNKSQPHVAPPPPEVAVVTVQPGSVTLSTELPGRLEASRVAEVRARVAGILEKRLFAEGSDVKAGQQLFVIDPAPYQAALQSAQAQQAQAEAALANASATAARDKPLIAAKAISQQTYDADVAAQKAAAAQVEAGKAAVRTASINLGYASVTAPISGRIGRALVTEGALVGQGEATQLALVQQIDPLYLNVTQTAAAVMKLQQQLAEGKLARDAQGAVVRIVLEDGSVYRLPGHLLFTDLSVDQATGEVLLRATVPNPRHALLPGLFVRARLTQAQIDNAILLPQQAVTRSDAGDMVMVVNPDGTFAPRPVQIAGQQGGNWIVTGGLKPGEQVMVAGISKVMMGAKVVKPVPWQGASAPAAGGQAPAPAASR